MAGEEVLWEGISGQRYKYWAHPIGTGMKDQPGNYIFAKLVSGRWNPIYVGETSSLVERFDNHHKVHCINANGATHIHAHTSSGDRDVRLAEETDLVRNYDPPCND